MASNSGILIPPPAPPQTVAGTNDIRPIKPPVPVPNPWAPLFWAIGILLSLAIIVTALLLWLAAKKRRAIIPPVPPHVRARQKIDAALLLIGDPRAFCIAVSDAVRVYLEERFQLRAPERTTEEFLRDLQKTSVLTAEQKSSLAVFLEQCDLVKFARFEPPESLLTQLHESALRIVDETRFVDLPAPAPTAAPEIVVATKLVSPAARGEAITLKERLIGLAIAATLIGIGVATWLWPHLHLAPSEVDPSGRGGRRFVAILHIMEWVWSRPLGTLLGIVGLAVLWGVCTRKYKEPDA